MVQRPKCLQILPALFQVLSNPNPMIESNFVLTVCESTKEFFYKPVAQTLTSGKSLQAQLNTASIYSFTHSLWWVFSLHILRGHGVIKKLLVASLKM